MLQVDQYLNELPSFQYLSLPSAGLSTTKTTAAEWVSVFLVVLPILMKFLCFAPLVPCIIALLEWHHLLCREIHTPATIMKLRELCMTLQQSLIEKLTPYRGGRIWKIPKFFALRKFAGAIKACAASCFTDTGYQESTHRRLKNKSRFTNGRKSLMAPQMSKRAARDAALERVLAALSSPPRKKRNSVVSKQ